MSRWCSNQLSYAPVAGARLYRDVCHRARLSHKKAGMLPAIDAAFSSALRWPKGPIKAGNRRFLLQLHPLVQACEHPGGYQRTPFYLGLVLKTGHKPSVLDADAGHWLRTCDGHAPSSSFYVDPSLLGVILQWLGCPTRGYADSKGHETGLPLTQIKLLPWHQIILIDKATQTRRLWSVGSW